MSTDELNKFMCHFLRKIPKNLKLCNKQTFYKIHSFKKKYDDMVII